MKFILLFVFICLCINLSLCVSHKKLSKTQSLLCNGRRFNIVSRKTNQPLGLGIRIPASESSNGINYYWAVTKDSVSFLTNSQNWVHTSLGIQNQYNNQYLQPDEIRNAVLVDWNKVKTNLEIDQTTVPGYAIIKYWNLLSVDSYNGGTFFAPDYSIPALEFYVNQQWKIVCL